ncbi:class III lanthionine synthetase LanKC [Streptomyces lonarensis]|uniref:non-specific serine/threonine protein kinase n=1 Tax=Streptomyces lonarensis TaxID=700599 RepID=A0A7X6CXX3_9ACTN|nr:class III lanthionine synthetase LanKC [Streptomyces lonarensis]NJQ04490.1 protein kinase/lanthionine synthetase C family protein [Streptomyces lonarensis]
MRNPYRFAVADQDFYSPLHLAVDPSGELRPAAVPDGWAEGRRGVWTTWMPADRPVAECGWKVHVAPRADRLAPVLERAAAVCFDLGIGFKHVTSPLLHRVLHQKQGAREQVGKFLAAYPDDVPAARRLMERLAAELDGEEGPYVLSDRRFGDRGIVFYRYGAFRSRQLLRADGTTASTVRDGAGRLVEDIRRPSFRLPEGITDPFRAEQPPAGTTGATAHTLRGYTFERVLRFTTSGGTYQGRELATGRQVFIKEARPHTAVGPDGRDACARLRREAETLRLLHRADPGLAPEPLNCFQEWEHLFLVTEFIEGSNLMTWGARHNPVIAALSGAEEITSYLARAERLIARIESAVKRLHATGHVFIDVSPGNVLVDEDDHPRLIDFEAASPTAGPLTAITTPGFTPPAALVGDDPTVFDTYGLGALVLSLVMPLHQVLQRDPGMLAHLRADLQLRAPFPEPLWERLSRYHTEDRVPPGSVALPTPAEVAAAPAAALATLRDRTADGLLALAGRRDERVFPTVPEGLLSNGLSVMYGTAGVLHALRRAGRTAPDEVLQEFRREALASPGALPPGLHTGLAGVAWVLADHGLLDEATTLLDTATTHPLLGTDATLASGAAGVALAHLALHGHTGDPRHLRRAGELTAALATAPDLIPLLGPDDATGLLYGRCGIALALQQFAAVSGESAPLRVAVRLLHAELDRDPDPSAPTLAFPVSRTDPRVLPYLYSGSAGMTQVVTRCLRHTEDDRLTAALPRLTARLGHRFTAMTGLYQGLSGLGLALSEHAHLTGDPATASAALDVGQGLFKSAVRHPEGVRFLGDQMLRFSAELWSGSAGVLLFLAQLLAPAPNPFFTVDADAPAARRG